MYVNKANAFLYAAKQFPKSYFMPSKAFVIYAQNVWQFCFNQHSENPFRFATTTPLHGLTQAGKLCEERLRALVINPPYPQHTHTHTHPVAASKGLNKRVQHKVLENTLYRYGCGIGYGYGYGKWQMNTNRLALLASLGGNLSYLSMLNKIKRNCYAKS